MTGVETMRERFVTVASALLEEDDRTAVVLADISVAAFRVAAARHPDRVINVGIREQVQIGAGAGLALEGFRPILHTYAPFLIERPFEQIKLDLGHQGLGAILVSVGASYDWPEGGRTHQAPADVAVMATLPGWQIHVPGHPEEVEVLLRRAAAHDDRTYIRLSEQANELARPVRPFRSHVVRRGSEPSPTIVAVGPALDAVVAAAAGLDATIIYAATVRPFDHRTLMSVVSAPEVVVVEPYLEGTSAHEIERAVQHLPHRILSIGVPPVERRRYGSRADHDRANGLDARGIRQRVLHFLEVPTAASI